MPANDNVKKFESTAHMVGDLKTVTVNPNSILVVEGDRMEEAVVDAFTKLFKDKIEEAGLKTKTQEDGDQRWATLQINSVGGGGVASFTVTIEQTEWVRAKRGEE